MSVLNKVTVTCDSCGKILYSPGVKDKDGWALVSIGSHINGAPTNRSRSAHHNCDYCPECVDKKGINTLLVETATKAQT